ncbi:unnamed protein product [Effrenium voratum]|uniref:Uncharacterized protein n=1 Tax=Effrenium voratum TaxID=2562239 RepID=A0AA36HXI9_9DINO|nr:unnamed protein product [Effrenium voratum]
MSCFGEPKASHVKSRIREEVVPWLHRGNLEGATGGLRRYSAAPGMMAQVAHGLSAGQSFSFVEVAGKQELPLVTAHSISTSQLPQDWQISTSVPALGANQMAFLLRVCSEDVAVLIGEWRGFKLPVVGVPGVSGTAGDRSTGRRGVQGRKGTKGKPGAAGRLHVQLFSLKSKSWCKARGTCSSPTLPSTFSIDLGPLGVHDCASTIEVNMATARLGGCTSSADCAVGYALALALAALHVALQPRMAPPQASKAGSEALACRMCHDCSGEACQKCREDAETISTCCSGDFHDAAVPDMCQSQDNPCADLHGQEELTCAWGLDVARCMAGVCDGGEALCLEDTTKIMACCDQHRHSVAPPRICTDAVLTEDVRSCVLEKCNECQGEQCELCKKDPQVLSQCCTEHQHGFAPPAICRVEDSRSILP